MMEGDRDFEEENPAKAGEEDVPAVAPDATPEEPVKKRKTVAMKWDAMDIQGRLDVLHDMEQRNMLPRGVLVPEYYQSWEPIDMRFCHLLFDVQEKVISYFRKNYGDLD